MAPPAGMLRGPMGLARKSHAGLALALVAWVLAGCGEGTDAIEAQLGKKTEKTAVLGFPALATKNTTRVAGANAVEDAAAVAQAVFPSQTTGQRPRAVTLIDKNDWRGGVAASVLAAPPLQAPPLLTDGGDIPGATSRALATLQPPGYKPLKGVQAFAIGEAGVPDNLKARRVTAPNPYALAAAIDSVRTAIAGKPSRNVIISSADQAPYAMPAAAYAARSGNPVLFVAPKTVPPETRKALRRHRKPRIFVLGPPTVISASVVKRLKKLGPTVRIAGSDPAANAVEFARFTNGSFGWGVTDPGHGLTIANIERPLDAAASAPLASTGAFAPLLLTNSSNRLPEALKTFLLDIQPGYRVDPVRGVYNHVWLLGDETAINLEVQGEIDLLAQIVRIKERVVEPLKPTTGTTGATIP